MNVPEQHNVVVRAPLRRRYKGKNHDLPQRVARVTYFMDR